MIPLDRLIKSTHPSVNFLKNDHERVSMTFKRPLNGPVDIFGNKTGSEPFLVIAHLYAVNSLETFPNANQGQQTKLYRGHAQEPKILPAWIIPASSGSLVIGGRSYNFVLLSIDRTSMPAYSNNFGERLEVNIFSSSKSF